MSHQRYATNATHWVPSESIFIAYYPYMLIYYPYMDALKKTVDACYLKP